jgi:threonine/homoserine/homoserine lactone efflux protein
MELNAILGFLAVSFALAMTPGADWAYAISAGLGRYRMSSAIVGLGAGYVFHTLLIVAGMAALIVSMPQLLTWLTLGGAAYLIWLGIGTCRSWRKAGFSADAAVNREGPSAKSTSNPVPDTLARTDTMVLTRVPAQTVSKHQDRFFGRAFIRGLGTSGTNPKALLLYLALIPQFIHADAPIPVPLQTAILGTSHMVLTVFIYAGVAFGAKVLLRQRPTAARFITLFSGIVMISLGLVLILEQTPVLLELLRSILS